jgi:hypothetical protein
LTTSTLDTPLPTATEPRTAPAVTSFRSYVSTCRASLVVVALATFGMYVWTVIVPYAFGDDYPILWMAVSHEPSIQFGKNILQASGDGGRIFAGLLTSWFFSAAGTIDNLRWVRLFAVVSIVAVALLLHWTLVRSRVNATAAALIAVFVCSMPPFQVYASWTVLFCAPLAALLSGGASLLATSTVDGPETLVLDRFIGAAALFVAALLVYQPPAMFYWVVFAAVLVGARDDSRRAARLARAHFAVAAAALAAAYLVTKLSVHLTGRSGRVALTHDPGGKAHYFLHGVLYQAANLFDLTPTRLLAAFVGLVAVVGIGGWLVLYASRPLLYIGLGVAFVPLSFLPNLVVAENAPTFRVQVSLTSLLALYACLGAMGIVVMVRDWLRTRVAHGTLVSFDRLAVAAGVAIVGLSAFVAASNVINLFAEPQLTELRMLRSQVAALPPDPPRVAFVQTDYLGGMTKLALEGEFGVPTSVQIFNLKPSLLLVLREQGRLGPGRVRPAIDLYSPYANTFPPGEPVIDLRGLRRLR